MIWVWPSTFILDADGVVRFVDKRKDGMIEAVAELSGRQRGKVYRYERYLAVLREGTEEPPG